MNMKPTKLSLLLMSALAFSVTGCNDGGGGGGGDVGLDEPAKKTETAITTEDQGKTAAASALDAENYEDAGSEVQFSYADLLSGIYRMSGRKMPAVPATVPVDARVAGSAKAMSKILNPATERMVATRAKAVDMGADPLESTTLPCDLEGEVVMTTTGTSQDSGSITIKFNNCKDSDFGGGYEISNGKMTWSASSNSDMTVTNGNIVIGDGNITPGDGDFVVKRYDSADMLLEESITSMKVTFKYVEAADNSLTWTFAGNGRMHDNDLENSEISETSIDNMSFTTNFSFEVIGTFDLDFTLDGAFMVTEDDTTTDASPDSSSYMGFVDFHYVRSQGTDTYTSFETIDGKAVRENVPAECDDGSYTFATTTPFKRVNYVLQDEGSMTINGTTTVAVVGVDQIQLTLPDSTVVGPMTESELHSSVCLVAAP